MAGKEVFKCVTNFFLNGASEFSRFYKQFELPDI